MPPESEHHSSQGSGSTDPPEPHPVATGEGLLDGREQVRHVALKASSPGQVVASNGALRRLGLVTLGLCVLIIATYVVPWLHRFRPWAPDEDYVPFWNVIGRELLGEGAELEAKADELKRLRELAHSGDPVAPTDDAIEDATPSAASTPATAAAPNESTKHPVFPAYVAREEDSAPEVTIENEEAMAHYYRRLTLVEQKLPKTIARAGHWGDSILGDDGLSHAIRRRLQARFGDAGHGFTVLGRYNLAYFRRGVRYRDRGGWLSRCEIIFKCEKDGHYGYGGVSTRSVAGGTASWATTKEGVGSEVSRFELWYATMPEGGDFQVKVDGEIARVVHTAADELGDAVEVFEVPDGSHEFEVRAIGNGVARGYGVVLEREGPGAVWDGLGLIGAFTQRLDYQDEAHIASQIEKRDLDLLVFLMGGNDVQREKMDLYRSMEPYETEYMNVLRKFKAGKPEASCLVMSVTDHGERVGQHGIRTRRIIPKLVESQRKVAKAEGCAFFDTFQAMGGDGAIERWYRSKPPLAGADLGHPTSEGHEVIASLFFRALMHGYAEYRTRMTGQPLPELRPADVGE